MDTKPAQDWDVVWDYTMGFPEENGFEKTVVNEPDIMMEENGLHIKNNFVGAGDMYVRYTPKNYELCNEGVFEVDLHIKSIPLKNGFRMILSNGAVNSAGINIESLQIYVNSFSRNSAKYQIPYNDSIISDITLNTEYIFRIERRDGVNYVYLNGKKIKESTDSVSKYATANRIFFQSGGEYLLKSIKFKKIS